MRLGDLKRRFGSKSLEEIEAAIGEYDAAKRAFQREHRSFREDAHRALDGRLKDARDHVEQSLMIYGADLPLDGVNLAATGAESLTSLYLLDQLASDEGFVGRLHAAIDKAPDGTYAAITKAEYEQRLAEFDSQAADLRTELRRREVEAAEVAAKEARRQLEGSAA